MSDCQLVLEAVPQMPEAAMPASAQEGLARSERREGVPQAEVAKRLPQWISKSSGRRTA